jgi:hypothetical protein
MIKKANIILTALGIIMLTISHLPACSSIDQAASAPATFWRQGTGMIETNDVARLQKELPFPIILPEYLPGGLQSYDFIVDYQYFDKIPDLTIIYHDLTNDRDIHVIEGPPKDGYPRPLPPGFLAESIPDYTPQKIANFEVLEHIGFGHVIRSDKVREVFSFQYIWEQNGLSLSSNILGYDQAEARKIIESMLKKDQGD